MRKQNSIAANVGYNGRITRSQAAKLHSSGCVASSSATTEQKKRGVALANQKRATLDENNTNVADVPHRQPKRKAVLQDVTNVLCENSYRSCFNATKIQAKNTKQAKRGQAQVPKLAPSVSVEFVQVQSKFLQYQANSKAKINKGTVKAEAKPVELLATLDTNVPIRSSSIKECSVDDQRCSQLHICTKKAEKDILSMNLTSCGPDYIDIDLDQKDPRLCCLYAADIYSNLCVAELNRRPFPNFMQTVQRDITQTMRGILVDWLVEVSEEYKLVPDTLYMTVYLIDQFLSQNYIERQRLQLVGITCMLIASKYEEICAPRVEEFCFITDYTYSREEVLKMERQVLKYFGFQLYAPTTKTFLRRFLRAAQASYKSPSLELEYLANFLAELTLVDYDFLNFLPSIIAASAVFLARWTLEQSSHPWNATLEHYTSYRSSDLKVSVLALQGLQSNTNGCPLNAIRMKYRQQKFQSVAALPSPRLLETLF